MYNNEEGEPRPQHNCVGAGREILLQQRRQRRGHDATRTTTDDDRNLNHQRPRDQLMRRRSSDGGRARRVFLYELSARGLPLLFSLRLLTTYNRWSLYAVAGYR